MKAEGKVFPTQVGVIPEIFPPQEQLKGFPHTSGGDPC